LVEAKAARTVTPSDAGPMQRLAAAWRKRPGVRGRVEQILVDSVWTMNWGRFSNDPSVI
jgi:hypothetical protein